MAEKEPLGAIEKIIKLAEQAAAKGAMPREEAVKMYAKESEAISPLEQRAIDRAKAEAIEWAKKAKDPKTPQEYKEAQQWARDHVYGKRGFAEAKQILDAAKLVAEQKGQPIPAWLETDTITYNSVAAEFAANIALLPSELQNNPAVLYREAAKMYWSTNWTTELDNYEHEELRKLLGRTFAHIHALQGTADAIPELGSTDPRSLKLGYDHRLDVYRTTPRVKIDDAGPEPVIPQKSKRGGGTYFDKNDPTYKTKHDDWNEKRSRQLQQENLHDYLRLTQESLDNPENKIEHQEKLAKDAYDELERRRKEFLRRPTNLRVISEEGFREIDDNLKKERNRIQGLKAAGLREARRLPVDDEDRQWIHLKDEKGNLYENDEVSMVNGKQVVRSKQALRDVLKQFEANAYARDENTVFDMWNTLDNLAVDTSNEIVRKDVDPYLKRIRKQIDVTRSLHWVPDNKDMKLIAEDWRERDRIFYERIDAVLRSRFEQSRSAMNLYSESGVDAFIEAVQQLHGDEMAQRYEHLKQSIYFNHDLELITRGSAGEVELFKKLVHLSHTSYMREAISDPIVGAMLASQEQSLRKILQDQNGYLNPDLFTFKDGRVYWDDLTMKFFKAKVDSGTLKDYKRNPDGSPVHNASRVGYELGDVFKTDDLGKQSLRLVAAQQQAKGIGMLTNRLLELFASAKAPGFETYENTFSSIPYEGISRFFRPMGHLFGKYHQGELSHASVFATLVGSKMPELVNFMKWSPDDWVHVQDAIVSGTLSDWLVEKYGEKNGGEIYKTTKPFIEIVDEFFWTGRFGPHSPWGENDATIGWSDKKRELEGGSIRIGRADWWAERYLDRYQNGKDSDWGRIKNTPEGRDRKEKLARAYKTYVWVQMTLRNPEAAAENVFNTPNGVQAENKKAPNLRQVLINDILHIDLATQVSTEATPNTDQLAHMNRIAILDADIAAVQYAALYGGPDNSPRDIIAADFDVIKGNRDNPLGGQITEAERKEQARRYVEAIRRDVLGDLQELSKWEGILGITPGTVIVKNLKGIPESMDDMLTIANYEKIDEILSRHGAGLLSKELVDRPQYFYMAMDDVRIGDMDISNLGERAFARLANDLEARQKSIGSMQLLLGEFKPHMDEKTVLKLLAELYNAEKGGRGPESAKAFLYYFTRLFTEYYRGHAVAKLPFLGQLLRRVGPELSIAQMIHGKEADVWSINNEREFIRKIAEIGGLPELEISANGQVNKYSIARLEREVVASRWWAFAEMGLIGYFVAAGIISVTALAKQAEEETKH